MRGAPVERLLARVDVDPDRLCWVWTGPGRYLWISDDRQVTVRWFAYEFWVRPVPDRHEVLPRCGNGRCVNPDHLVAADMRTRPVMKRAASGQRPLGWVSGFDDDRPVLVGRGRVLDRSDLVCERGHWVIGGNARTLAASGVRQCRQCRDEADAELLARPIVELDRRRALRAKFLAARLEAAS